MMVQDPIFGTLEHNGGWKQNVYMLMFSATLPLLINNSPESPLGDEEHGLDIVFYQNQIDVSDAGAHWLNHDHYDLQGKLLYLEGEE